MKKITILAMVLVLCLGAIGVGYAAWTDEVQIDGTVTTGSVDLEVVRYSGTFIYKDLETDAQVSDTNVFSDTGVFVPRDPTRYLLVAYAAATPGPGDDQVTITYWNIFPDQMFRADFKLHYAGSIPAIVDFDYANDDWISDIPSPYGLRIEVNRSQATGAQRLGIVSMPYQMHYCDYILVDVYLKIPQDNELQGLTGSFTITFTAIQWNEYSAR